MVSQEHSHRRPAVRLATFFVLLALALGISLIFGVAPKPPKTVRPPTDGGRTRTTYVYDGDTIQVEGRHKVRLLGIDAMDSHNERRMMDQARQLGMTPLQVRKWSRRARKHLQKVVENEVVRLRYGPERTDDYGRLLAYIFRVSGKREVDVNADLVARGLATATRRFSHPRREEFIRLEHEAREDNRGLWKDATRVP